jgi:pimeloyl-ACP methyl ester carboxylesterase
LIAAESTGQCVGKSDYVDVGGAKLHYEECGSGPAVVLLHDGLLPSVSWDEVWQPLAAKYHVVRYDRRGYGRSDLATTPFSPVRDLAELLRHLKVKHAIVVGNSSGGALALDFAIEHPEMVDGLFLVGPVLHGLDFSSEFRERANRNNEPMEHDDVRAMARNWSQDKFLVAGANEKARRKIYEELVANAEKLKKYDGALEEKLSTPASKRLGEIKMPTLILVGEGDIGDVQLHTRAISGGISGSERIVVKGAGHLIQLEKPGEVVSRLENFAARVADKQFRRLHSPMILTNTRFLRRPSNSP